MTAVVPDASVAVKWFLTENGNDEAQKILESNTPFIAPEFLKVEFDSVITKYCRAGFLDKKASLSIIQLLDEVDIFYYPYDLVSELAFEYTTTFPVTLYDAIYIATAELSNSIMLTFDKKLGKSIINTPLEKLVKVL